jgi:hypothetical protein
MKNILSVLVVALFAIVTIPAFADNEWPETFDHAEISNLFKGTFQTDIHAYMTDDSFKIMPTHSLRLKEGSSQEFGAVYQLFEGEEDADTEIVVKRELIEPVSDDAAGSTEDEITEVSLEDPIENKKKSGWGCNLL